MQTGGLSNNAGDNTIQNSIGFFHTCELKLLVILQSRVQIYLHQPNCLLSISSCFYTVAKKLPHTLTRDKHLTHFFWMINTLWYHAHLNIRLCLDDLGANRIHQHNSTNSADKNNHPWKENRLHRLQLAKTTFCAPRWFACIGLQIMTAEPKTSLNFKATIESFCQWWWSNNQLHSLDIPISAYVSYTLWTLHMLFGAMWLVHFTRRNIQSCTKNAERTILQKKENSAIRSFLHRFEALIITIVTKRMWETYHTSILAWGKVSYHLQQTQIKQTWRS